MCNTTKTLKITQFCKPPTGSYDNIYIQTDRQTTEGQNTVEVFLETTTTENFKLGMRQIDDKTFPYILPCVTYHEGQGHRSSQRSNIVVFP